MPVTTPLMVKTPLLVMTLPAVAPRPTWETARVLPAGVAALVELAISAEVTFSVVAVPAVLPIVMPSPTINRELTLSVVTPAL